MSIDAQSQIQHVTIRFSYCTFTYNSLDFVYQDRLKPKTTSKKVKRAKVKKLMDKLNPIAIDRMNFENCSFNPSDESKVKKLFQNVTSVDFGFNNCKFVRRPTSIPEKLNYHLRKLIGFPFTMYRLPAKKAAVVVKHLTFRLKDVPKSVFKDILLRIEQE